MPKRAFIEWWLARDAGWIKVGSRLILYKTPSAFAYWSERTGIAKPLVKIGGWRLFIKPLTEFPE